MIRIGEYFLDSEQARLTHKDSGVVVNLEPKLNDLLLMFVTHPNQIISRQDILDDLWQGTIVTDNAINKLVGNLRKLLGDDAKSPRYIETVPKRGYRLVCSMESADKSSAVSPIKNRIQRSPMLVVFTILVAVFLLVVLSQQDRPEEIYSIALTQAEGIEITPRMHPDSQHLYYLRKHEKTQENALWIKNLSTSVTALIRLSNSISEIIALEPDAEHQTTRLFYLNKTTNDCGVFVAELTSPQNKTPRSLSNQKLFACEEKRIKDIGYNAKRETIYYAAQPKNFQPNHIYAFDLSNHTHQLVTQLEPSGWGHHNLDVSPNGDKLLIMSTDSEYQTQLLSLDLTSNTIEKGMKFKHPVTEAIWHHDAKQIIYFSAPPSNRILKSSFDGSDAATMISVTDKLSPDLSRFPDGESVLFSTEQKNYSSRWLVPSEERFQIANSVASDVYPALYHKEDKYLFVSNRNEYAQIYSAEYQENIANIATKFGQSHVINYVSMSADDKTVAFSLDNHLYALAVSDLNSISPIQSMNEEQMVFETDVPIIYLDWLSKDTISITSVENGTPTLNIVRLSDRQVVTVENNFSYGLGDAAEQDFSYFVQASNNRLYAVDSVHFADSKLLSETALIDTGLSLPKGFYHPKIDGGVLSFVITEAGQEYLYRINIGDGTILEKHLLSEFSSYDVSNGKIMVSEVGDRQGNIYRTVH